MAEPRYESKEMLKYAFRSTGELCRDIGCPTGGLTTEEAERMRELYGPNSFTKSRFMVLLRSVRRAFVNPFSIVLFILGAISVVTDILPLPETSRSSTTSAMIFAMIAISGTVRLVQELKAKNASEQLEKMVQDTINVKRDGVWDILPSHALVTGDLIALSAGDRVPADVRISAVSDLFISQSALTGESGVQEKTAEEMEHSGDEKLSSCTNLAFMGTTVISGRGEAIVMAVGRDTIYGRAASDGSGRKNSFEKGANSIAWVLLRFMAALIPIIFILLGITGGKWLESFAFALSVAVGLVPEMLPMVITACLAKGALAMRKKETVVKDINAMQSFGSMDVLCMDKTGTLTSDSILLEYYMDVLGNEDGAVLDYGYLNSIYHTGIRNSIDNAIAAASTMPGKESYWKSLAEDHAKLDEIPFDHTRKSVSILVSGKEGNTLVMKGDVDSVISRCSYLLWRGSVLPMEGDRRESTMAVLGEMLEDGMKTVAVAVKDMGDRASVTAGDERDMVLLGYLVFFDAPKPSARVSVEELKRLNVRPKILTGDRRETTVSLCRRVGMDGSRIITGSELNRLPDSDLKVKVEETDAFAELSPSQKVRVVSALRENGHTVGFLGDGINDIPALGEADVGISVDSAVDAAKDSADVVLLEKDLRVLSEGIMEGRRIFSNMMKYIRITASSNFGNIFSVVCAAAFLPFLPMASIQLLLLNLLYDILCTSIPWDNVDREETAMCGVWSGKGLSSFMLTFGPISSLFDIITFLLLYFVLCPRVSGGTLYSALSDPLLKASYVSIFQTGWFLESLWTQVLILHFLRTRKIPFIQSRPSDSVIVTTLMGALLFTLLTESGAGGFFGLVKMPSDYYLVLLLICIAYMLLASLVKHFYQKEKTKKEERPL